MMNHGYRNDETFRFISETENRESVYLAIRGIAEVFLNRVPSMTAQTLGRNIRDSVENWIIDSARGIQPRNYGWADKVPVNISGKDLADIAHTVGDIKKVSETDIGDSWIETIKG